MRYVISSVVGKQAHPLWEEISKNIKQKQKPDSQNTRSEKSAQKLLLFVRPTYLSIIRTYGYIPEYLYACALRGCSLSLGVPCAMRAAVQTAVSLFSLSLFSCFRQHCRRGYIGGSWSRSCLSMAVLDTVRKADINAVASSVQGTAVAVQPRGVFWAAACVAVLRARCQYSSDDMPCISSFFVARDILSLFFFFVCHVQ